MSSAHSMNARKCVQAQKPYPSQAFAHESRKVGGRSKKRDTGKTEDRRLMERKTVQQNKNLSEELKPKTSAHLNIFKPKTINFIATNILLK